MFKKIFFGSEIQQIAEPPLFDEERRCVLSHHRTSSVIKFPQVTNSLRLTQQTFKLDISEKDLLHHQETPLLHFCPTAPPLFFLSHDRNNVQQNRDPDLIGICTHLTNSQMCAYKQQTSQQKLLGYLQKYSFVLPGM